MSTRTLGEAQVLGLRLFLEGLEIPVISATVDSNEGSAAVAQIEIVGLDSAMRFKPRTVVHLFFFDGADYKYGAQTTTAVTEAHRADPTDPFSALIPAAKKVTRKTLDDRYRLLFMGELFSYTYQKSGSGARSVVLNCIDFSNYWDTSFVFQVSGEEGLLDVPQIQPFITGSDTFVNTTVEQSVSMLIDQLSQDKTGGPQLSQSVLPTDRVEFLSSLLGVLELLGGVSVLDDSKPPDPKDKDPKYTRYTVHGGLTAWHTLAERRVRLLDQLATDDGKTAAGIFEQETFLQFLKRQSDLTSSVLSFRDLLNLLLGHVYYSTFPMPCGRLLTGEPFKPHALGVASTGSWAVPTYTLPTDRTLDPRFIAPSDEAGMTPEQALQASREFFLANPLGPVQVPQNLSKNFTFNELTDSTQHPNLVPDNRLEAIRVYNFIRDLCLYVLEPLKEKFPKLHVNSGFRGPTLNKNTKGASSTSQHLLGQAADLVFGSPEASWQAFKYLAFEQHGLPVGQVIFEKSGGAPWVHVSLGSPWFPLDRDIRRSVRNSSTGNLNCPKIPAEWTRSTALPPEYK